MSRLYDTVEPSVIDDDMLQKAVEEQGPKEEAGKIAKDEGINFAEVKALRLDFKSEQRLCLLSPTIALAKSTSCASCLNKQAYPYISIPCLLKSTFACVLVWLCACICFVSFTDILKIDNLWCFKTLTKLQLDNNIIEKVEGLDVLQNLIWLGKCSLTCSF